MFTPRAPAIFEGYPRDDGSPLSSCPQAIIGTAATIQFHPGAIGLIPGGFEYPAVIAGPPKHTAIPNHPVSVGVANILTVLAGDQVPSFHQADSGPHLGPGI